MDNDREGQRRNREYSKPVCDLLDRIEVLVIDGLRHGFFRYSLKCEIGNGGRRDLVIEAGKSDKFIIRENDLPR